MAVGFSLTVDADFRRVELALDNVKQGAPRAMTRAINRTLIAVRAAAGREIAADIGIPVRPVRDAITLKRATFTTLMGFLRISGQRIPLIDLRARGPEPSRGKGQGVSYSLRGQRKVIPDAFIVTFRSGHRGVFRRRLPSFKKSRGAWSENLPLKTELRGPSIPFVAAKNKILGALKRLGRETLQKNLRAEVRFLAIRRTGAGGE